MHSASAVYIHLLNDIRMRLWIASWMPVEAHLDAVPQPVLELCTPHSLHHEFMAQLFIFQFQMHLSACLFAAIGSGSFVQTHEQ